MLPTNIANRGYNNIIAINAACKIGATGSADAEHYGTRKNEEGSGPSYERKTNLFKEDLFVLVGRSRFPPAGRQASLIAQDDKCEKDCSLNFIKKAARKKVSRADYIRAG
jgi:hypothetical protein